jgi:hypothetical protein
MPYTATNIQNVKLGACSVSYGGVDLGLTKGGVAVTLSTQNKPINVDQFGQTVINDYIMGRSGTVKVPMAETDINKLVAVIPGASIVIDKNVGTKQKLVIPTSVGQSLYATALPLILHPTANAGTNLAEDVTVPLAAPTGNVTFDFQEQNERVFMVEFTMYPDATTGLLCTIGDPSASAT